MQYPSVIAYAIPNGGQRHPAVAAKLKREGVTPGIPDIHVADGKPGLYIEMKDPKKGRLSDAQKKMIENLSMAGYQVAVCYGWEQAKDAVNQYLQGVS